MHTIEPFYLWRDFYQAEDDPNSLTYGKVYDEFYYTDRIYNFIIHPQWDSFGSETLYFKLLFADYERSFCVIELIGEWNDCIGNDIMYLKNELIDCLADAGISHYIIIMENVLNFHSSDLEYYKEWKDDIKGEIFYLNVQPQVIDEMNQLGLSSFIQYDDELQDLNWRTQKPEHMLEFVIRRLDHMVS